MTGGWRSGTLQDGPPGRPGAPLVMKIGGSLLARPAWPETIAGLLAATAGPRVLVVGGGPVVDGLRAIDAAAPRPAGVMHWLAIEALGITSRLVAEATGLPLVETPEAREIVVLDVPRWLRIDPRLPEGWHVTSDSIAAVVAAQVGGGLLLAKSEPPSGKDLRHLAAAGWVDAHFPEVAGAAGRITWAAWVSPTPPARPADGQ
jgi:hypothetical protein